MSKSEKRQSSAATPAGKSGGSPARKVTPPASRARTVSKKSVAKSSKSVQNARPILKSRKPTYRLRVPRAALRVSQVADNQPALTTREKASFTIPALIMVAVRERAEQRQISASAYVTIAIQEQLDRDNLGDLLADMERANGPLTDEEFNEALAKWPEK